MEITLLCPLILGLLIAIMTAGFYLHDRACLQGAASEMTAAAVSMAIYEESGEQISGKVKALSKNRLMWTTNASGSVQISRNEARAFYTGSFHLPGMAKLLWQDGVKDIHVESSRKIFHAAASIRKIRGAQYVMKAVSGS